MTEHTPKKEQGTIFPAKQAVKPKVDVGDILDMLRMKGKREFKRMLEAQEKRIEDRKKFLKTLYFQCDANKAKRCREKRLEEFKKMLEAQEKRIEDRKKFLKREVH